MPHDPAASRAPDPATILDLLTTAILVVDAQNRVSFLNAAAADLLAASPAAARGRRFASLLADGGQIETLIVRSRQSGEPLAARGFELAPAARDDARHQVDLAITPLLAAGPGAGAATAARLNSRESIDPPITT